MYPAWVVDNSEDIGMTNRVISSNAVPIIHSIKTSIREKSFMLGKAKDIFTDNDISFPVEFGDGIDFLNKNYGYYKIEDVDLKRRLAEPYVQTSNFVYEAINLERTIVQGYISAKEKSGKRKDRVMSLVYGLSYALELENALSQHSDFDITDYIFSF